MFRRQSLGSFDFHDQYILDQQIHEILSEDGSVFIKHFKRMLLLYVETQFPKSVR